MDRADLVFKLVEDLEPLLERYASTGIEIAVLISKVNDNVVGYQGTQLGKDFLEKQTHYTESFRKFCREYWYGSDNVISNSSPKKSADEGQDISFLSATETGAVLSGIDSITVLDGTKLSLSNILGNTDEAYPHSSPKIVIRTTSDSQTEYVEKKKIRRKAKFRCSICSETFFRREHRRNIHMHEFHSMELSELELAAYPLPDNYAKKVEVKKNEGVEDGNDDLSDEKKVVSQNEKKKLTFKYHCNDCNIDFKKMVRFNEHRSKYHQLKPVPDDYGKNGYQCGYCPKVFSSRWNLERHIAIHLGHRKFKCGECDQSFFRREELKKHELRHKCPQVRKSYGKILCYSCGQPMRVRHGENCSIPWSHGDVGSTVKPIFKCKLKPCGWEFEDEDQYDTHVVEHGKEVMFEHDYNTLPSSVNTSSEGRDQEMEDGQSCLNTSAEKTEENEPKDQSDNTEKNENNIEEENKKEQAPKQRTGKGTTNDQKLKESEQSNQEPKEMDEGTYSPPKIVKLHYNHENISSEKKPYQQKDYEGAFQCKICHKSFVTNFVLKRHALLHGDRQKVICEECGSSFSRKDLLTRHIKRSHGKNMSNTTIIKCNVCPQMFKDPISLKYHKAKMHKTCTWKRTQKSLKKTAIGKSKVTRISYVRLSATESKRKRLSGCVGCDEGCQSEISPSKSKSQKLDKKVTVKDEIDSGKQNDEIDSEKQNEENSIEGFVFSVSDKSHKNYTCKKCKISFRYQSEYVSHQLNHTSKTKIFPCVMCPLAFKTLASLMKHQQKHDKNGNFSCNSCTFSTDSFEHLCRHKGCHKEKKPKAEVDVKQAICDQCGKECANVHRLKEHMLTHSGEKPHKCSTCEKTFHTLDILKNHKKTHLDDKPYMCEDCGKTFHQSSTLSTHRLVHFQAKIGCKLCSAKFRKPAALRSHMVYQHSDTEETKCLNVKVLKCDFCDKTFVGKKEFDRHKRTHTGEKPFKCTVCDKGFADRSNCKAHEKIHVNKKNKCDHCEKEYVHKQDLKRHVTKFHPNVIEIDDSLKEVEDNLKVTVLAVLGKEADEVGEIDVVGEGEVADRQKKVKGQTEGKDSPDQVNLLDKNSSGLNNVENTGTSLNQEKTKTVDLENEAGVTEEQAAAVNLQKSYDNPISMKNTVHDSSKVTPSKKGSRQSKVTANTLPVELVQNSVTMVENEAEQSGTSDIGQETQPSLQNILLHTNDEDNGPSTIYVVQTMSDMDDGEPKIICFVDAE